MEITEQKLPVLIVMSLLLLAQQATAQAKQVFINSYLYQDTVLWVDTLVREQRGLKVNHTVVSERKPKDVDLVSSQYIRLPSVSDRRWKFVLH